MTRVIVVCGSRDWAKPSVIQRELLALGDLSDTIVVHGACRGADSIAAYWAKQYGAKDVIPVPAEWEKYGRKAGPIRNRDMIVRYQPHLVLAFTENLDESRGTKDLVTVAVAAEVITKVITK